jgi:hypothetical protein
MEELLAAFSGFHQIIFSSLTTQRHNSSFYSHSLTKDTLRASPTQVLNWVLNWNIGLKRKKSFQQESYFTKFCQLDLRLGVWVLDIVPTEWGPIFLFFLLNPTDSMLFRFLLRLAWSRRPQATAWPSPPESTRLAASPSHRLVVSSPEAAGCLPQNPPAWPPPPSHRLVVSSPEAAARMDPVDQGAPHPKQRRRSSKSPSTAPPQPQQRRRTSLLAALDAIGRVEPGTFDSRQSTPSASVHRSTVGSADPSTVMSDYRY